MIPILLYYKIIRILNVFFCRWNHIMVLLVWITQMHCLLIRVIQGIREDFKQFELVHHYFQLFRFLLCQLIQHWTQMFLRYEFTFLYYHIVLCGKLLFSLIITVKYCLLRMMHLWLDIILCYYFQVIFANVFHQWLVI